MKVGILIFWAACCVGWILNVIWFLSLDFQAPLKAEIIRGIGVFIPPIGAILGYVPLGN
jgi:hypothetical protein